MLTHSSPRARAALTLVEVVASTMIVGMMCVAALNSLGAATRSSESIGNRAIAAGLADELMAEIMQANYSDPNDTPVFGTEGSESSGTRAGYDDIDDYNGWNQSPPRARDGTQMANRTGWRQRVTVAYVVPSTPSVTSVTDQGVKRVKVTIEYNGKTLAEQTAFRTNSD